MPTFRFSLLTSFSVTAYVAVGGAILAYLISSSGRQRYRAVPWWLLCYWHS